MTRQDFRDLAAGIEEAGHVPADAQARLQAMLVSAIPAARCPEITPETFENTDAMLLVIDRAVPGWSITLDGTASEQDGHWVAVLRSTGVRDNDGFVGIGKAASMPRALLVALLNALAFLPAPA